MTKLVSEAEAPVQRDVPIPDASSAGTRLWSAIDGFQLATWMAVLALAVVYSVPQGIRAELMILSASFTIGLAYFTGSLSQLRVPVPVAILFLYVVASVGWSASPERSFSFYAQSLFGISVALLLVSAPRKSRPVAEILASALTLVLFVSILAVLVVPRYAVARVPLPGWRGFSGHKNVLSMIAVAQLGVVSGLFYSVKRSSWIAIWSIGVVTVLGTQSSTGAVAGAVSTGVAIYFARSRSELQIRTASWILRCSFLGFLAIAQFKSSVLDGTSEAFGKTPGLSGRSSLWAALNPYIAQHPVTGLGFGGVWQGGSHWQFASDGPADPLMAELRQSLNWGVTTTHNQWYELALQLGFVGLVAGVFVTLRCVKQLETISCRSHRGSWYGLYVGLMIMSFTESIMLNPLMLMSIALLLLLPANDSKRTHSMSSLSNHARVSWGV